MYNVVTHRKLVRAVQNKRREQILTGMTWKYSVVTSRQIADTYFATCKDSLRQAERFLEGMIRTGFIAKRTVMAHLLTAPNVPLFSWEIGQSPFDANAVKNVIDNRWVIELVPTTIYSATRKAVNAFGGQLAKSIQTLHICHDLYCASVYLSKEEFFPEEAADWLSERVYESHLSEHEKPGDARLRSQGEDYRLIEILGRYTLEHIQAIHPYCESRNLPYELW